MNKDNINEFASFDEYLRQGEPSQKERAENWKTAIGLQAVDGLQPSAYLLADDNGLETYKKYSPNYSKT